ncbi:MAG: acyl-CoA dehydrogenase C-terminal domain-containing protein [Bdellovibrio sp.]
MAKFKTDLRDIYFNLFDYLNVTNGTEYQAQDLKDIIEQYSKFIESEVWPTRETGDREGVKLTPNGVVVPECFKNALSQYYQNGWFALGKPEEIGGMPAPHTVSFVCTSILCGANMGFSMYPGLSEGAMNVINQIGSDTQKNIYIPAMMEGRWGGTMCLTEPGAGSDVGACKTMATPKGDGTYSIKGVKIFISSGENNLYENIIHLVLARTPGAPEGTKGLSLFIVPRINHDASGVLGTANGVKCTKIEEKMGIHGSATCELTFGADNECVGFLIGKEFEGMQNMFIMMNEARLLVAIHGESQASLAYQLAEQYAKERVQFGTEIINHMDVKRLLIKSRAKSRALRALNLYTANLLDQAKVKHELESMVALLVPVCKSYCSDEGFNICVDAVQIHGGYGYCSEYGIEQFVRDAKIATIYEGTNAIQGIDFVMRKILRDEGSTFKALVEQIANSIKTHARAEWKEEQQLMADSLKEAGSILERMAGWAKDKKMDQILCQSSDFLNFCGHLVCSWLLMEQAAKASLLLGSADGDDKFFLQTKIDDFKFICRHVLSTNAGLAKRFSMSEEIPGMVV